MPASPLLEAKSFDAPSVFLPENLLREARRQRGLPSGSVPDVCVLDPDGDLVRYLVAAGRARRCPVWACYHTDMHLFEADGLPFGVVGCAVGASFAVLVAEQMFASGCKLLLSVTSSGQIADGGPTPYFILIERALRDEGTSHHYLPPARFADADPTLLRRVMASLSPAAALPRVVAGATWTTDAPYRETETAIAAARALGAQAVEMEAAALYAFAAARRRPVLCFAHVTNQMARVEGDFEKGEAGGAPDALALLAAAAHAWRSD